MKTQWPQMVGAQGLPVKPAFALRVTPVTL